MPILDIIDGAICHDFPKDSSISEKQKKKCLLTAKVLKVTMMLRSGSFSDKMFFWLISPSSAIN